MFACTGFTIKLIICKAYGDTFINANNAVWIRKESKSSVPLYSVCYSGIDTDGEHNSQISLSLSHFVFSADS